jgi:hypothetical protein
MTMLDQICHCPESMIRSEEEWFTSEGGIRQHFVSAPCTIVAWQALMTICWRVATINNIPPSVCEEAWQRAKLRGGEPEGFA